MDWLIHGRDLFDLRHLDLVVSEWVLSAKLDGAVRRVVDDLHALGIAHNDLYTTNLFVDRYWGIAALIDWDGVREDTAGEQYLRRIQQGTVRPHDWDYLFLRYCRPFGNGFVCSPVDGNSPHGWVEPFVPFVANTGLAPRTKSYQHILTPKLWLSNARPPETTLVILTGGTGREVLPFFDEDASPTIAGFRVSRIFTRERPDPALRRRNSPATSSADFFSIGWSRDHELCRRIVQECPSAILLSHWDLPLPPSFAEGLSCPNDLRDPDSVPRIFTFRPCTVEGAPNAIAAIECVIVDDVLVDGTLFVETYTHDGPAVTDAARLEAELRVVRRIIAEFMPSALGGDIDGEADSAQDHAPLR
ncbi:hypothetical protein AURDEDRAFT_114759 [Auricularia subglabra TFB-10046 SS5]|nr:hypothetical protein AURDEDRAFT_114759 [Auricularia subglabra TFB-10046 SS5]